jgi:hypothetical protein
VFVFDERGEAIAMIVAPDGSWTSAHDVLVKGLNWFMNPLATLGGGEVTKKSLKNPDERNIKEINLGILSRAHGL